MTCQLVFPTSPPTFCWVCGQCRPINPAACGPECIEEES